jgi:hypothetical protein
MPKFVATTIAILLALVLVQPVGAQGPKGGDIPGLGDASDAPEGIYVPEGMTQFFRTFVTGYTGFLNKVASKEPGFRSTLQEIITNNGQQVPPPVANWDDAANQLFGFFDSTYAQYKQTVVPAATPHPATRTPVLPTATPTISNTASADNANSDSTTADTAALAIGLTGLVALLGTGAVGIGHLVKMFLV